MHQLTDEESATIAKAEQRRQTAARIQIRLSAYGGTINFIDALLDALGSTTKRNRLRLESGLVSRKGRILFIMRGLGPLVNLFKHGQSELLSTVIDREE